jgi:dihydrolipoamide dehydrogenase
MATTTEQAGLVVIGAGPGGYPAAFLAADLGMNVTLVDLEANPGGVCLYRGCIPSKALLHVARYLEETREIAECGVRIGAPEVDLDRLRAWKQSVVDRLTRGLGQLRGARPIRFLQGRAEFSDHKTLRVHGADGVEHRLAFEHALLATGSRPTVLPGWPVSPRIMDSTAALELPDVPGRLLVVGGGYIGLELGSVYAALGAKVSVVELLDGLLPGADRDLVAPLEKRLSKRFDHIRLRTRVTEVADAGAAVRVTFEDAQGARETVDFDRLLVSVGRVPNSGGLGLDRAGVAVNARGFVEVDDRRRTSNPAISAIGDVVGSGLAHVATHEAKVAVESMRGKKTVFEPRAIPAVVFTDPEIAWAGLTETQAQKEGRTVRVARFPWTALGRALTLERTEGLAKIVVDPESERILGVGLCGVGAGDMIAEGALAIEMGATVADLQWTIHPHPTLSESIMEAAEVYSGHCVHQGPVKKK